MCRRHSIVRANDTAYKHLDASAGSPHTSRLTTPIAHTIQVVLLFTQVPESLFLTCATFASPHSFLATTPHTIRTPQSRLCTAAASSLVAAWLYTAVPFLSIATSASASRLCLSAQCRCH